MIETGSDVQRGMTYGEQACGVDFNPSHDIVIGNIKQQFAKLVDKLNMERGSDKSPEQNRLLSIAITELQGAQMWAIKAITYKY
jgi:hypothetical protein